MSCDEMQCHIQEMKFCDMTLNQMRFHDLTLVDLRFNDSITELSIN